MPGWLNEFERSHGWEQAHGHPSERAIAIGIKAKGIVRLKSHRLWIVGLALFWRHRTCCGSGRPVTAARLPTLSLLLR